jgi:hypothetical protein
MVDAWSAELNITDTDAKNARAKALEEAADTFFDAYIKVGIAHDVIPYMHKVSNVMSMYVCHILSLLTTYHTTYRIARHY